MTSARPKSSPIITNQNAFPTKNINIDFQSLLDIRNMLAAFASCLDLDFDPQN